MMMRHLLKAAIVVAAIACLIQDAQAGGHQRRRAGVSWIGGWGPGPFGKGNFPYANYYPGGYTTRLGHWHP